MRSVAERNQLVLDNLPLALWAVRRRTGLARRLDPEDARQEAVLGLLLAAERWDPGRGTFSTVALSRCCWQLRRAAERASLVRVPAYLQQQTSTVATLCRSQARQAVPARCALHQPLSLAVAPRRVRHDPGFQAILNQEEARHLASHVAALPLLCQVILRLRFWDGLPRHQVCHRLGLTIDVVRRLERQALTALRRFLGEGYREER